MASKIAQQLLSRSELDAALDPAGNDPDCFAACLEKVSALNCDLEIRDPKQWRKPGTAVPQRQAAFLEQFRRDVDSIIITDRADEMRLARSIEFARQRLEGACLDARMSEEAVEAGIVHPGMGWSLETARVITKQSLLPKRVTRRWLELHALRTELVERNLYLVPINVERYSKTGASRTDLIQEGCISLFRAVDGFDWRRGLLFRTYAVHWLNQAFRNHLYNFGSTVRVPVYLQKAMKHVAAARTNLGDRKASIEEIAQVGDMDQRLVKSAVKATRMSFSLDAELGKGTGNRLGDLLEDERIGDGLGKLDHADLAMCFCRAFRDLSQRERNVLRMRFGMDLEREFTLAEVARDMELSIERVRQIQIAALRKLGAPAVRRRLEVFLN